MLHLTWLTLALLAPGPVTTGRATFRPTPAEADVPAAFRMVAETFSYERQPLRTTPGYTVEAVRFPSPVVTPDVANNTVHAEYFRPTRPGKPARRRGQRTTSRGRLRPSRALPRGEASRSGGRGDVREAAVLRREAADRRRDSSRPTPSRSVMPMRQGVLDVHRHGLPGRSAWMIDAARLGVTGISAGGIIPGRWPRQWTRPSLAPG